MSGGPRPLRLTADGRLADAPFARDGRLRALIGALEAEGEEARVVGGAVRNALLGLPVADVDLATSAEPRTVMRIARRAGFRALPTGVEHGTVTVLVEGASFEVTTLREDVDTDGRHAVVRFARDFAADARRRDFTMNALSADADGRVHDTVGGLADLAAGRVRFIGAADTRIREDYLRILRFFRFHAAYGLGPLDPEGLAAAVRHGPAMERLSRERVRAEWLKLLASPGAPAVVETIAGLGLAARIVSVPCRPERLARLAAGEARRSEAADALLRLAALCVDLPSDAAALRADLRLSNEERDRLADAAAARAGLDGPPEPDALRALLFRFPRAARDGVRLAAAAAAGGEAGWDAALALLGTLTPPVLPLGGAEVMARGVAGGRRVGAILKRLQADWIRAGFPQQPAALAELLDAAIAAESEPVPEGPPPAAAD